MERPFPFDAVLFDLDGTLVATDRFWVAAARTGARRAFEELGLEREIPGADVWMAMVGLPIEVGFEDAFGDLEPEQRAVLLARCMEEEHRMLAAGDAALMPGAEAMLRTLRAAGVRTGIASNCGQAYLDAMMGGLGLAELVEEGRCLDSAGIRDKADMIGDLLATFGTRSAVMVGDRAGDADAAHANALPHVHLTQGFAPGAERVECEAAIGDLGELLPRLERRGAWIDEVLRTLGAERVPTIGVTGSTAAGKTLLARDLARFAGRPAAVVALDAFARAEPGPADADVDPIEGFDVERLVAGILEPHARGEPARGPDDVPIAPDALLVVEGPWLLHPRLRVHLDRTLFLSVDEATSLGRAAARLGAGDDVEALARLHRTVLPAERRFAEVFDPAVRADLVLDGTNPLGPAETG